MSKNGIPRQLPTETEMKRRRTAAFKHGRKAKVVTAEEVVAARLARLDPDAVKMLEDYVEAQAGGNLSVLDKQTAVSLTSAELVRRQVFDQLAREGLTIEETILNSEGVVVGKRKKVHPLLENLKWLHEVLGQTARAAGLTREPRPRGALAEEINAALARDQRLRAASKLRLPEPDPELFRQAPEELARSEAEAAERRKDPVFQARLAAAEAIYRGEVDPDRKQS